MLRCWVGSHEVRNRARMGKLPIPEICMWVIPSLATHNGPSIIPLRLMHILALSSRPFMRGCHGLFRIVPWPHLVVLDAWRCTWIPSSWFHGTASFSSLLRREVWFVLLRKGVQDPPVGVYSLLSTTSSCPRSKLCTHAPPNACLLTLMNYHPLYV